MKSSGVVETFSDFRGSTKILIWAMLALGAALFAACLTADLTGASWMETYAYIPNILAGITGFLIGVPFALVVFATLAGQREDTSALARVNKMTELAWYKFRDSALAYANAERVYAGLKIQTKGTQELHDEVFAEYQRWIAKAEEYIDSEDQRQGLTDPEIHEYQRYLKEKEVMLRQRMDRARDIIGWQEDLQNQWSIVRSSWNTLSQYVRLQRLERNLPWFDDQLDGRLSDYLTENKHPLTQFMRVHDTGLSGSPVPSMSAAISHMQQDIYGSPEKLREKLMASWTRNRALQNTFGWQKVEGYYSAAWEAHIALAVFKMTVEGVDKSGWPGNATQPTSPN